MRGSRGASSRCSGLRTSPVLPAAGGQKMPELRTSKMRPSSLRSAALHLALAVFAALCLQGAGLDAITGLHAAKAATSFSPKRVGSTKFKGKPEFRKPKAFGIGRTGKKVTRTSLVHLRRMVKNPENATIMEEGCNAMWYICMNANEQDALGRHRGACAAVVVSLKQHMDNEVVVLAALKLACNLCYAQPKNPFGFCGWAHTYSQGELGGRQQGIPDIVQTMKIHKESPDVQNAGIRALANLVYNHTDNVLRNVEHKGIEAVIAGMKAHPTEMAVQEGGCLYIWSMLASIHNESYITFGIDMAGASGAGNVTVDLSIAGRLAELGAVPAVIHALNTFGCDTEGEINEDINVGEQGCAALWFLSVKPGRLRKCIIESGGIALAEKVSTRFVSCSSGTHAHPIAPMNNSSHEFMMSCTDQKGYTMACSVMYKICGAAFYLGRLCDE